MCCLLMPLTVLAGPEKRYTASRKYLAADIPGPQAAVRAGLPVGLPRWEGAMRTAVVTGAARGLGRAMTARLTADGFAVWAVDADEATVKTMAGEVGATACVLDLSLIHI